MQPCFIALIPESHAVVMACGVLHREWALDAGMERGVRDIESYGSRCALPALHCVIHSR